MIDLSSLALCCALVTSFLVIWFNSTALVEYLRVLDKLLGGALDSNLPVSVKDYDKQTQMIPELTFLDFLLMKKNGFLMRLISCPTCLSAWLSLFACAYVGIQYWPFIYLGSLVPYLTINKTLFR